jgi:hypothetical protein
MPRAGYPAAYHIDGAAAKNFRANPKKIFAPDSGRPYYDTEKRNRFALEDSIQDKGQKFLRLSFTFYAFSSLPRLANFRALYSNGLARTTCPASPGALLEDSS